MTPFYPELQIHFSHIQYKMYALMKEQITKVCNCNLEIFPSKILLQVMRLLEILLKIKL